MTESGKAWSVVLRPQFREHLRWWVETDQRTALRLLTIMDAIARDPFRGIGQPEPLRGFPQSTWSRRLTQEHRVVYAVVGDEIYFLQAWYHY